MANPSPSCNLDELLYQMSAVGILAGADLDFGAADVRFCEACGGPVDMSSIITVQVTGVDGVIDGERQMSEANARMLLAQMDIPAPPVMCDQHKLIEISTERFP